MSASKVFVALSIVLALAFTVPPSPGADVATGPFVHGEIVVKFKPGASADVKADAHRQASGTPQAEIARTSVQLVKVPAGQENAFIARYEENASVLFAEPNFIRRIPEPLSHDAGSEVVPGDYYFDEEWGLHNTSQQFQCYPWFGGELCSYVGTPDADIDAPEAWAISMGSPTVKVAIIDTGIDYTHPDLAPNYERGRNFTVNPYNDDPMDDHGHGTHVAGTVGGAMNNQTGSPVAEEGIVGVAPNARILAYKVCDSNGSCNDFAIMQGIAQAILDGAKVINMSLGGPDISQSMDGAVQDAWTAGLVIAAAAGNDSSTSLFYPAAYDNVISVAAFDEDHKRAPFSNYGSWVDISAPGNVIMSSYPMAACGGASGVPGDTGCYNWLSGTSMAAPHVSGAAALVWSRGDVTSNAEVVNILLQSADGRGVAHTRLDSWTINGGLNIHDAMSLVPSNQPPVANAGPDQTVSDSNGDGSENVTLDGSASSDADGTIVSYVWSEGGAPIGSGATLTHLFAIGSHVVTLTVTDNGVATATDSVTITVQPGTDTVVITKATYNSRLKTLTVEATSTGAPSASLTAYDYSNPSPTDPLGVLAYNSRKNKYAATFPMFSKPTAVKVTSSLGGSATRTISVK